MNNSFSVANYFDLEGKHILITGASRGIGLSIARALAAQKAKIVFNYRGDESKARGLQEELLKLGAQKATGLLFDMKDVTQMKETLESYLKENGPISGLVNNAGISKDQLLLRLKEEEVSDILDTNLKGPIMLCQALSRNFLKAENVSIVNVSSVVGLMGNPSQIAYSSSKAGLIGLTKSLAKELGSRNVRCNAICPGFIQTEMTDKLDPKVIDTYKASIPLGRFGVSTEVAELVCFLLSKASSYITGEVIKIDGGLYA